MSSNKLVTCPYDIVHRVKESRLSLHITKCRLNHLNEEKFTCPFNATHILPRQERDYHLMNCPDRAPLDRTLTQSMNKNNPFKGRTDVPSYTASAPTVTDEVWDDDDNTPTAEPSESVPPAWAIIEPPPLAQPAERRRLYQELHRMPTEIERHSNSSDVSSPKESVTQQNRQPKAPSQVESKKQSAQEFQSLGLGRGRPTPTNRIAANIFPSNAEHKSNVPSAGNYSAALTSGMSNLGLGRGINISTVGNTLNDDDEFPALGCGRGIHRPTKNGVKYPGSRS